MASVVSRRFRRTDANGELAHKVRELSSPRAYLEPTQQVRAIETHFAWVFLTDAHAYKLKKPIRLDDLDWSSLAARAQACAEELRVNRRFSPDVYLATVPLAMGADGRMRAGGAGEIVDWLVKMQRLPDALMLDRAIAAGTVDVAGLDALGARLATFYRAQRPIELSSDAYLQRLRGQIATDQRDLLDPELGLDIVEIQRVVAAQHAACARLAEPLGRRAEQGRIIEAHGDLRPEHVCLRDPPCIIDAMEFSRDLRILDPLEELSFFGVECEHLGAGWVGDRVLQAYRAAAHDEFEPSLIDFYRSRRSAVRAKVVAWHLLDPQVREDEPWVQKTNIYLDRALRYARAGAGGA